MSPAGILRLAVAVAAAAALTACAGPPASHPAQVAVRKPTYYLALGDSLSQGVQPDAAGVSVKTEDGYPDQLYAALHRTRPGLQLVKLGCPGETTTTMIGGGMCRYQGGSQLAAAAAFLRAHRGQVLLVTLDIGANDPEQCGGRPGLSQLARCAVRDIPSAVTHLTTIMDRLTVADPDVRIVGMTYYLPALAEWQSGLTGRMVARVAEKLAATYNRLLTRVYVNSGARVANVFGVFQTSDFGTPANSDVPRNVARLCQWTWACAAPPRGPNQHANQAGYQVIARTFQQASGLS